MSTNNAIYKKISYFNKLRSNSYKMGLLPKGSSHAIGLSRC